MSEKESEQQLPLFYKNPAILEPEKHGNVSLRQNIGYKYADGVNAVPVNLIELPQVAHAYPIAFSNDGTATPVAILGIRDNENLYVDANGKWEDFIYIPAYVRRYPFIFSEINDGDQLTLCMDMVDEVQVEDDSNPLFEKDGTPTQLAQNALEFCRSYHSAARQSSEFSQAIAEAEILVDRQAEFNVGEAERLQFSGFQVIDEQKLNALDEKLIADWHKRGWLGGIYAHLFSSYHWARLSERLKARNAAKAA